MTLSAAASPHLAVVGAGPVGLALALLAAARLPDARITVFDARPLERDVSQDPRTIALSLGSVHLLERLGAWRPEIAQPILEVRVSQQPPSAPPLLAGWFDEPTVCIRAVEERVPMLGAVMSYGEIVAPLQQAWLAACEATPHRLAARFGTPVGALKPVADGVEIDAGIAERFDLAVVAEGGVFGPDARGALAPEHREPLRRDYRQAAWVGTVTLEGGRPGVAHERFTRHGPAALLPLRPAPNQLPGTTRAALVWCVPVDDDPVESLDDDQRLAVLGHVFDASAGRIVAMSPLKRFPLGLIAERTLADGRSVRIGNAAQTLHPVAGQGLNLGLRDAFSLVQALAEAPDVATALRRVEWQRASDRWATIGTTDFLARSFTWHLPGAGAARGLGLAAVQAIRPLKSLVARQMMFGWR